MKIYKKLLRTGILVLLNLCLIGCGNSNNNNLNSTCNNNFVQAKSSYPLKLIRKSNATASIDLVVLPEGYTASEIEKFRKDIDRLVINGLFTKTPYKENLDKFNIYAIEVPSKASGYSDPFFGSIYITDPWAMTDLKNRTFPSDFVKEYLPSSSTNIILINSSNYGGRGHYYGIPCSQSNVDNRYSEGLLVHEFSHAFANLKDEYGTGSTVKCTMNWLEDPFCDKCKNDTIKAINQKIGTAKKPLVDIETDSTPVPSVKPTPVPSVKPTPVPNGTNLALNKSATASSYYSSEYASQKAFDGDSNTHWAAKTAEGNQWITVDLSKNYNISSMQIKWSLTNYPKRYTVYSWDGSKWVSIKTISSDGNMDEIKFDTPFSGKTISINCSNPNSSNYVMYECEIYGK